MDCEKNTRHGWAILKCPECKLVISIHIHVYLVLPVDKDCRNCPGKMEQVGFQDCLCELRREDYVRD